MAEYWKSTPKYWCKFCKTFVKDTSIEKKQHESTAKHQNSIQKSLRDLHKNQSREEREKQQAKNEVARLNGVVSGKSTSSSSGPSQHAVAKSKPQFTARQAQQSSAEDRRRQAEQLAAMGIAVPDDFRKDMAIASDWSVVSAKPVFAKPEVKDEDDEDSKDDIFSTGRDRKRKLDDEDDDEGGRDGEAGEGSAKRKKAWGTAVRTYPERSGGNVQDFDALLSSTVVKKEVKAEPEVLEGGVKLKKEASTDVQEDAITTGLDGGGSSEVAAPVVFKKRKGKR